MADPIPHGQDLDVLVTKIKLLEGRVRDLESPSGTQRAQTVRNTPLLDFQVDRRTGFAVGGSFAAYVSVDIPVPQGRNYARVLGIGSAAITDMVTGGVTTSSALVRIESSSSGEFPASKDAAVSRVINVLSATHSATIPVAAGGLVTVSMQLKGLNPSAFTATPTNFAQLAVLAAFTYQEAS